MTAQPTWGVVLPAHNAAGLIADAITSLLGQTEPPQQIVVCDDGSSDDLASALAPYRSHVQLIRQPNRGPAAARNVGARHVETEWILFLDADDWLSDNYLECARHAVRSAPEADMLVSDALGIDDDSRKILYRHYERTTFPYECQREAILTRNFLFAGVSVRRSAWDAVGGFDETLGVCEDWDCWQRMVLSGSRVALFGQARVFRRHHGNNLSSDRAKMLSGRVEVLRRVKSDRRLDRLERRLVARSIRENRRALNHLEGSELLRTWSSRDGTTACGGRLKAARLVMAPGTRSKRRAVFAAGSVAPRLVGRLVRHVRLDPSPAAIPEGETLTR